MSFFEICSSEIGSCTCNGFRTVHLKMAQVGSRWFSHWHLSANCPQRVGESVSNRGQKMEQHGHVRLQSNIIHTINPKMMISSLRTVRVRLELSFLELWLCTKASQTFSETFFGTFSGASLNSRENNEETYFK